MIMILMMMMIIVIIITIMIMIIKTIIMAVVNTPFQQGDFSTRSTTVH